MARFLISLVVVLAVLAGGWFGLLRGRRLPLPPQDVLDRVKQRERELEAKEKLERRE
jgi:Tfp pilus assembly protein PilO